MNIPLETWPILAVCLLLLLSWWETRSITQRLNNARAIDDERRAREASYPTGNVTVLFDQDRRVV